MALDDEPRIGRELHERRLAGEPTAPADILERYYEHLVAHLRWFVNSRNLYRVDEDLRRDAAVKAFISYHEEPTRYDPMKGKTLAGYLRMSALGDLKNLLDREMPPSHLRVVELTDEAWNMVVADEPTVDDDVSADVDAQTLFQQVMELAKNEVERIVARLWWLSEERKTEVYARELGLDDLTPKEQAAAVQKIKDRLDQRRRRRFPGGRADEPDR